MAKVAANQGRHCAVLLCACLYCCPYSCPLAFVCCGPCLYAAVEMGLVRKDAMCPCLCCCSPQPRQSPPLLHLRSHASCVVLLSSAQPLLNLRRASCLFFSEPQLLVAPAAASSCCCWGMDGGGRQRIPPWLTGRGARGVRTACERLPPLWALLNCGSLPGTGPTPVTDPLLRQASCCCS